MTSPESATPLYIGNATLRHDEVELGTVRVQLFMDTDERTDATWGGHILGSDYLMWGMNHKTVELGLDTGQIVTCVVQATGRLRGLGEGPDTTGSG